MSSLSYPSEESSINNPSERRVIRDIIKCLEVEAEEADESSVASACAMLALDVGALYCLGRDDLAGALFTLVDDSSCLMAFLVSITAFLMSGASLVHSFVGIIRLALRGGLEFIVA